MNKTYILFTFLVLSAFTLKSQVVYINEVSIANISKQLDPNYDFRGWIELYNTGEVDIELKELYFSDEPEYSSKYRLAKNKRTLPAGGYALVWLNGEIRNNDGFVLDADADGGFLSIADNNGNLLDVFEYSKQFTNVSYGRTSDGADEFGYFVEASPGASNNDASIAFDVVAEPVFSHTGGFYDEPVRVSISCRTPDARIFYTLDGSNPGTDDAEYNETLIFISESTPLRARAFAENMPEGTIATATYVINERKPDLPIVFLTVDTTYLYNDTIGIYCVGTNGIKITYGGIVANYNQDWTRPAHLEFLDANMSIQLSQSVNIGIHGNDSRKFDLKAFEVKASKRNGTSRFDYPLFEAKPGRRYKSFILRGGGQQDIPGFIFRDAYVQSLVDEIDLDYQAYRYCVLYVNAKYWGIRNMREKSSNDYVYSHYNYEKDEYDLIDRMVADNGNTDKILNVEDFVLNNDLANDSVYRALGSMIDLDSYLNYIAAEIFFVNTDWPSNNNKQFAHRSEDAKFRWIFQDLDRGFSFYSRNVFKYILDTATDKFQFRLLQELSKNALFIEQYITRMCVFTGSIFREDRMLQRLNEIVIEIQEEYPYHVERWDPVWVTYLDVGLVETKKKIPIFREKAYSDLQLNFGLGKPVPLKISASEPGVNIHFNDCLIPLLPFDGKYFVEKSLNLSASAYANAKAFAFWQIVEDGNKYTLTEREISLSLSSATEIVAVYRNAPLVRRVGLYINEISASNSIFVDETFRYEDWIELYNSSDSPIALKDYFLSDKAENKTMFRFGEGSDTVPAFGYSIVWCSGNLSRGAMHVNFKLDKEGEELFLSKEQEGELLSVDSVRFVPHSDKVSFGRYPDASDMMVIFNRPSFKTGNYPSRYNQMIYFQEPVLLSIPIAPKADPLFTINISLDRTELIVENSFEQRLMLDVYSVTGQKLISRVIDETLYQMNLADLSAGIYIIRCHNGTMTLSRKFIR